MISVEMLLGIGIGLLVLAWLVYVLNRRAMQKRQARESDASSNDTQAAPDPRPQEPETLGAPPHRPVSFFEALSRSRTQWAGSLRGLFGAGLDDSVREELETVLLSADVGVETTEWILDTLTERARTAHINDPDGLLALLKSILSDLLSGSDTPLDTGGQAPFVILMVGVNGVGKTTTIGKLAHRFKAAGQSVLLGAGDTFRAAAVEQLKTWGARHDVPVIAQETGADSASVLFDACQAAKARGFDIVLADTAGRLQNKSHLMGELEKIGRVLAKLEIGAPHEVLLVLDAATGQNAISQTREFSQAIRPTGLVLTKLDGTAKGGIVFALAREFDLPIRFVGLGEQAEDLQPFDRTAFVDALFAEASGD